MTHNNNYYVHDCILHFILTHSVGKEFKVQTRIIPIDFGTQDVYPKISSSLEGLDIGILGIQRI